MGQAGSRRTEITRALRENEPTTTVVELGGVRLTEKEVRKLSEALRQNSVVQKLSLAGCELTPGGVQHVAGVLCNSVLTCSIRRLSLSNNDSIGELGAQCLASVLETNQVLEHLILNGCSLGDDGLEPIVNGKFQLSGWCQSKLIHFLGSIMSQQNIGEFGAG
jgi:Ran GTPase-activating protein (RanGAP) involved in mRNA processing and transport